jgi:hypothetical protein
MCNKKLKIKLGKPYSARAKKIKPILLKGKKL